MSEGFFGRWSRLKNEARPEPPQRPAAPRNADPSPTSAPSLPAPAQAQAQAAAEAPAPASNGVPADNASGPTLAQAQQLPLDADFTPFLARHVAPAVKNAAMKRLFSDPHFNVMDGLDVYIDDYNLPNALPAETLKDLLDNDALNAFRPRPEDEAAPTVMPPPDSGDAALAESVAPPQPNPPTPAQDAYENPDLRLQQDHDAGAQDPGRRAG